jgi:hypothetical protein
VYRTTAVFLFLLFTLASPTVSSTQQQQPLPIPRPTIPTGETEPGIPPEVQKEMEKRANQQRQADLKRDTERLLKLSTELKEYVDKTNENMLSLDVIKKADEIEKLAHSVKTKMRGNN